LFLRLLSLKEEFIKTRRRKTVRLTPLMGSGQTCAEYKKNSSRLGGYDLSSHPKQG
jgi:hypothetical protein